MNKELLAKLQNLTILYAEDEEGVRKNIADSLRYYSREVYEAKDGEEAYLLYEEKKPDIILSDIHMPKMSGIEFIKKVREKDLKTAVIMITAHTDKEYLLDAVELHMEKYFVKPIILEQLLCGLEKCVEHLEQNRLMVLEVDNSYVYDFDNKELKYKESSVTLNKKEMLFFETLITNQNRITYYGELQERVWDDDVMTDSALRSLVRNLRKKLPTEIIYNLSGVGYKFV